MQPRYPQADQWVLTLAEPTGQQGFKEAGPIPRVAAAIGLSQLKLEQAGVIDHLSPTPTSIFIGGLAWVTGRAPVRGRIDWGPAMCLHHCESNLQALHHDCSWPVRRAEHNRAAYLERLKISFVILRVSSKSKANPRRSS